MKRHRTKSSSIELLLTACAFCIIVALSIFITLTVTTQNNAEKISEYEVTNETTNVETVKPPIQTIHVPANNTTTKPELEPVRSIIQTVPFTSQAPTGTWSDARQQNACEEASALMAMWWVKGQKPKSSQDALQQILDIANYEEKTYGTSNDTNPTDTVKRIFGDYFKFTKSKAVENISLQDIIQEIMKGHLVILPMDGVKLANPHYTQPGPERHTLLIVGYDAKTQEFVTNDSGTKFGSGYHYKQDDVYAAIREYPTGDHLPITGATVKSMIVVSK